MVECKHESREMVIKDMTVEMGCSGRGGGKEGLNEAMGILEITEHLPSHYTTLSAHPTTSSLFNCIPHLLT